MATTEYAIASASASPPAVFNIYPSAAAAMRDLDRAGEFGGRHDPPRIYGVMTLDAFIDVEREYWLSQPERAIDQAEYVRMLEILPPLAWETTDTSSRFLMSEMTSGPYTEQYIQRRGPNGFTYAVKIFDALDRATWMS